MVKLPSMFGDMVSIALYQFRSCNITAIQMLSQTMSVL